MNDDKLNIVNLILGATVRLGHFILHAVRFLGKVVFFFLLLQASLFL